MAQGFEAYSAQHFGALGVGILLTTALIRYGRAGEDHRKVNVAILMAGLTFASMFVEAAVFLWLDRFVPQTDLPFYLCDVVALAMPFVLYTRHRRWIGVFYFWALAGTLQALITPDIEHGFPSFYFFKYFFTHGGIVATILYVVVVWRVRIDWRDFFRAIVYAQFYLIGAHLINQVLGSNYSYTMQKPAGPTLLDLLGPWPWYILWGEVLMAGLFLLLMVPFLISARTPASTRPSLLEDDTD